MGMARTAVAPRRTAATGPAGQARRVREQASDVLAVMAFSAASSVATALLLVVLTSVGR